MADFNFGVELGPLDSAYIEKIRAWRNNPKVMRWCRQNDLISDVQQAGWFERQERDTSIKMYAVLDEGALVGVAGLTSIDRVNGHAEFSLYIAPEKHTQGYGRKALKTLLSHGFYNLGFNVIWGECLEGNRALNLFTDLGMVREGTRRQFYFKEGRLWDAHLISMTRAEWKVQAWSI